MKASKEDLIWNPDDESSEVSIYLLCDSDNCHIAYKATEAFLKVYNERQSFEKKVFEVIANDLSNDDGMVDTWDEEVVTIYLTGLWG